MASIFQREQGVYGETRFFHIMAWLMCLTIVAGFVAFLAMGMSTFAVPLPYHVHAVVFMGWLGFYLAQNFTIDTGRVALHRKLGKLAYLWVPLMVLLGFVIMFVSMRRSGGPFIFDQNQFLFSNLIMLLIFGGLAYWGLMKRRYQGWHRRLIYCAMGVLTGPGFGRFLPMPLFIPNAWHVTVALTLIWPVIGIIADLLRNRKVHPAYFWAIGLIVGGQIVADLLAYSDFGVSFTQYVLSGTPGAERPMEAFLPPGFSM